MPLQRVDFICPRCGMFCKPEHPKVEVERTEDRVAYGHEKCYRVNGNFDSWEDMIEYQHRIEED